jgi:hypothetical protein
MARISASIGNVRVYRYRSLSQHDGEKWLHNFGQFCRWIGCLTAGTVVLANQERR